MVRLSTAAVGAAALLAAASAQADGNPHGWSRQRRCDHAGYSPKCGPCEGLGGITLSDKANAISIPACTVIKTDSPGKRPVWGADFTETQSHEILIGKKTDKACFQAFPGNVSTGDNCYKPQECVLTVDFKKKNAMRIDANQAGNAWGLVGNVTSLILHQGQNMWITNTLPLGITQTICTGPREGGDKSKPPIYPVQYNWVDNLIFVATENIDVEYGVGQKTLDHWAFGPHHAWTDGDTGLIVRMWQPYNGLQIFAPGTFHEGHDEKAFEELSVDGKASPKAAQKVGGSTFRIKCTDDGFPTTPPGPPPTEEQDHSMGAGLPKASVADLKRARTKVPRGNFKGDNFEKMSQVLNGHLMRSAPKTQECDSWAVEELQQFQVLMMITRDPALDDIYHNATDNRRIRSKVSELTAEWKTVNELAAKDPELMRIHRDGHCHEAVMWYVHHLSQETRDALKDKVTLPLLSYRRHAAPTVSEGPHGDIHRLYEEKVTCFSCHSNAMPSAAEPTSILV